MIIIEIELFALFLMKQKIDLCALPIPIDTQKASGYFSPVISEENYYICSLKRSFDETSPVVSSLSSYNSIPLLIALSVVLMTELAFTKYLNIESLVAAFYQTVSISLHHNISRHSKWLSFICLIILMFPVFIFNASFNTQTVVPNIDTKINTLRDVVTHKKTPIFFEGISMYDLFKAKVTKDYADVYELAKAKGFDKPFKLGMLPDKDFQRQEIAASISGTLSRFSPLFATSSGLLDFNEQVYLSEKPFHKSQQAMLFSHKLNNRPFKAKIKKL